MAELQSRLGPKVYGNKSWVRPGLDNKSSPKKAAKWKSKKANHGTEYDSDSFLQDGNTPESAYSRKVSRSRRTAAETSLLNRISTGHSKSALGEHEAEKSLLERVGLKIGAAKHSPPNPGFRRQASMDAFEDMDLDSDDEGAVVPTQTAQKIMVKSEPFDDEIPPLSNNEHEFIQNIPALPVGKVRKCHSPAKDQLSRQTDFGDHGPPHNLIKLEESHPPPLSQTSTPAKLIHHISQAQPSENKSQDNSMASGHIPVLLEDTASPHNSLEDGELDPQTIRDVLLPLILKNASGREEEGEIVFQPHQVEASITTLTDEGYKAQTSPPPHSAQKVDSGSVQASPSISSPSLPGPSRVKENLPVAPRAMREARAPVTSDHAKPTEETFSKRHTPPPPASTSSEQFYDGSSRRGSLSYQADGKHAPMLRYTPSPERANFRGGDYSRRYGMSPKPSESHYGGPLSGSPAYTQHRRDLHPRGRPYRRPGYPNDDDSPHRSRRRYSPGSRGYGHRRDLDRRSPSPLHRSTHRMPRTRSSSRGSEISLTRRSASPRLLTTRRVERPQAAVYESRYSRQNKSPSRYGGGGSRSPRRRNSPRRRATSGARAASREPRHCSPPPEQYGTSEIGNTVAGRRETRDGADLSRRSASPPRAAYQRSLDKRRTSRTPPRRTPRSPRANLPSRRSSFKGSPSPKSTRRTSEEAYTNTSSIFTKSSHLTVDATGVLCHRDTEPWIISAPIQHNITEESTQPSMLEAQRDKQREGDQAATHNQLEEPSRILPRYNAPEVWFFKLGLDDIGTMECSFEIDQETASRWNFPPSSNHPSEAATKAQELKTNLHLQICCLPRIVVDSMMEEMTSGATIQDLAMATSQIENHWPTTGHLIIKVNPQSKIARTWLPHELKPTSPPVLIQNCVRQGINTVQFIQLSGMSEHVFVLFAIEKPSHPDDGGFVVPPVQKTSDRDSFNFGPSKVSVTLIDREGHPIG